LIISGAIGVQDGKFIDSEKLFNMAFGKKWTNAQEDWQGFVQNILYKVIPILQKGGKVWVKELDNQI